MKQLFTKKFTWIFTLAIAALALVPFAAFADNVVNDVTTTYPSGISLIGGDPTSTASVGFKVVGTGGDSEAGCNIDAGESLTIHINTPSGVSASPDSLTFGTASADGCGIFKFTTLSAAAAGTSGNVTVSITSNSTGSAASAYSLSPATFPLTVTTPPPSDTTAPVIAAHDDVTAEATSPDGAAVSYTNPSTSDAVDGDGVATCSPASGSQFALGNTTVTCNATDVAGNAATPITFVVSVVDTTPPALTVPADIVAAATSASGAVVSYSVLANDAVDATPSITCSPVSGSTFAPGSTTVSCTASDATGNTSAAMTFKVTVNFSRSGFYQPIDMNGIVNNAKRGSVVPVKFEIFGANGVEMTDTAVVRSITYKGSNVCTTSSSDDIETYAASTAALRYDLTGGQFIQNWKAPSTAGCYALTMTTTDGQSLTAIFNVR
jgi:hypothetical protein